MDSAEESYKQAVLPHFLDGLNSLNSVAEILQINTDLLQDIPNNVRQLLESSFKSLSEAEKSSQAQEREVSKNGEKFMNMIKKLEDEQKLKKVEQQELKSQLSGLQVEESLARDQQQAAKEALNNAKDLLGRAQQAQGAAEKDLQTGIGLLFIPILGPIIGGITISNAKQAIEAASREARWAVQSIVKWTEEANKYESKLQSFRNGIRLMKQTLAAKSIEIQANKLKLSQEKTRAKNLQEFLIPLRKCTTLLGSVESSNVMEFIDKLIDLLPALNDIIDAIRPLIYRSSEYQLLISTKILDTVAKMEEAKRRNL